MVLLAEDACEISKWSFFSHHAVTLKDSSDGDEAQEPQSDTSSIEEVSDEDKEEKKAAGGKKEKKKKTEGRAQEEGIAGTKQGN